MHAPAALYILPLDLWSHAQTNICLERKCPRPRYIKEAASRILEIIQGESLKYGYTGDHLNRLQVVLPSRQCGLPSLSLHASVAAYLVARNRTSLRASSSSVSLFLPNATDLPSPGERKCGDSSYVQDSSRM